MTRARFAVRERAPLACGQRSFAALATALTLGMGVHSAAAGDDALTEAERTFEYTTPAPKDYGRAALEEIGLLSLGLAHYYANQDVNSSDWDQKYDWPSLRSKLVGDAYALDTNFFDTNFVSHPVAGMLYYFGARSNRLSVLESLGYAFVSSAIWEFAGEFRELVSINDLIVTPFSGFTLGESTIQLGAFFDRSCSNSLNPLLGSLFGPAKSIHDAVDGVAPARDTECDRYGFSAFGGHRFRLFAGGASVTSDGGNGTSGEARFGASAEVLHLHALGRPGQGWMTFSDGNVSSLSASVSFGAESLTDLTVGARTVPGGIHHRDLVAVPGFGVKGTEFLLGVLIGSEYSQHRYDRPNGKMDRIFVLDLPATMLMFTLRRGPRRLEVSLDAGATFGGVDAFALGPYAASGAASDLSSTTDAHGYSHAVGFALAPRVRLALHGAEIGIEGRSDRLYGLGVLDRSRANAGRVSANEVRRRGTIWLSVGPPSFPRATFFVDGRERRGTIEEVSTTRGELSTGGSVDAAF